MLFSMFQLCCGSSHSAVLTSHGEVYTWGVNSDGQLATGNKLEEVRDMLAYAYKCHQNSQYHLKHSEIN